MPRIAFKFLSLLLIIVTALAAGCGGSGKPPRATGAISLSISDQQFRARTIQPGLDMNLTAYDIHGAGPEGETLVRENVSSGTVLINSLKVGDWTITVDGKNGAGVIIASGYSVAPVTAGQTVSLTIEVQPLSGNGVLRIALSWPAGRLANPVVEATLAPSGGSPASIAFAIAGDNLSATYENNSLPVGYYTLNVELRDGTSKVWGAVEVVRILAGQTSAGTYPLSADMLNSPEGGIEIGIAPNLHNPIEITFSGQLSSLPQGSEMTVTATTSQPVDSYQWYLNGALLSGFSGPIVTVGNGLARQTHRLDLIVATANLISSGTVLFNVVAAGSTPGFTPAPGGNPTPSGNPPGTVSPSIAAGRYHSLAAKSDGTVWAWGQNSRGQLGDGTNTPSNVPVRVSSLNSIKQVAAGQYHSLALNQSGTLFAWGDNQYGQIGNGTAATTPITAPVQVLTDVKSMDAGGYFSVALRNDGTVWAWGQNNCGQLGIGNESTSNLPVQIPSLNGIIAVSAGYQHVIALKNDGTVWVWGYNFFGQLGNGEALPSSSPIQVSAISSITHVNAGENHCLAIKSDGTVWGWGLNGNYQIFDQLISMQKSPVKITALTDVTTLSGGDYHSLALKNNGSVWAWGSNDQGQLGSGTGSGNQRTPLQVGSLNATQIASKYSHSLALTSAGAVYSWGDNEYGQLGQGTTGGNGTVPSPVSGF
jgi:alpha-tubulin suppressor-like RCC1 family protein